MEGRSDIEAAAQRMNVTLGGRREIRKLPDHLWPGEQVEEMTTGSYGGGTGLVVLSDRRLLFIKEGWVSNKSDDFPMERVSSVSFSSGLMFGKITVFASGNRAEIEAVDKQDGKRIVDHMRHRLSPGETESTSGTSAEPPATDPVEQLRKLGELRDAGVVSEEEFAAKKRELLSRL